MWLKGWNAESKPHGFKRQARKRSEGQKEGLQFSMKQEQVWREWRRTRDCGLLLEGLPGYKTVREQGGSMARRERTEEEWDLLSYKNNSNNRLCGRLLVNSYLWTACWSCWQGNSKVCWKLGHSHTSKMSCPGHTVVRKHPHSQPCPSAPMDR